MTAAKHVINKYPELKKYLETDTDEELQAKLILDDKFNIRIASKYLMMMEINKNPDKAITAYNLGKEGSSKVNPSTHKYTQLVKSHIKNIKKTV